jgi:hypothetical protein
MTRIKLGLSAAGPIEQVPNSVEVQVYAPEISNKIELDVEKQFTTMELLYNHISYLVVEGLVLMRILVQLMLRTATSKEQTDWQKYPRNKNAIGIQYSKTIESITCPTFPEMGVRPLSACLAEQLFSFLFMNSFNSGPPAGPLKIYPAGPCWGPAAGWGLAARRPTQNHDQNLWRVCSSK